MCGIVGYIGKGKNALNVLIDGLKHLEYRGYDSAGVAYIKDNKVFIEKETGRIKNLEKKLNFEDKSNLGIGHTRWATHGKVTKANSHPHNCEKITIVHNGIIENYIELKEKLIKKGYKFKSETDTEVAAVLLNDIYKQNNNMLDTIKEFKKEATGAYAIAAICEDDLDTLYAIKKNSPLIIGINKDENYIASDVPAIISYTNKYITLEDGSFAKITKDKIELYNNENKQIEPIIKTYEGTSQMISKCGYDHYMVKEINEQPDVVTKTFESIDIPDLSKFKRIIIVACGSAMHAGLVGKNLIETYGNIPVEVEIASEFRYKKLFLNKSDLVIAISQSGETADTLEAVKIAKKKGIKTLGIINVKESSIAREVDNVIYTKAGPEIAVATTKAYMTQVLVLAFIAYSLAKDNPNKEITTFLNDVKKLPKLMQEVLNNEKEYEKIAKKIHKKGNMFYIGRSIDYALCMEGSLKIKEISYLHSEAYAAGELKHGTISLIEKDTPVIGIVTDEFIADKTISNLKEVSSRGANVIYLTTDKLDKVGDFYNEKIIVPKVNPLLQPLVSIIPLQLIAYHVAKLNKCDIDKPKNLAKSVTVE